MKRVFILFLAVISLFGVMHAQRKSISSVVEQMQKIDGYVPAYFNPDDGKTYIEITRLNTLSELCKVVGNGLRREVVR